MPNDTDPKDLPELEPLKYSRGPERGVTRRSTVTAGDRPPDAPIAMSGPRPVPSVPNQSHTVTRCKACGANTILARPNGGADEVILDSPSKTGYIQIERDGFLVWVEVAMVRTLHNLTCPKIWVDAPGL